MSAVAEFDFSEKRRLHPVGLVLAFLRFLVRFMRQGLLVLILIIVQYPHLFRTFYFWLGLLGLPLLVLGYAYMQYRNYTYHVDTEKGEFVLERGIWSTSKTVIKFSNIIQVNVEQNFLQKLFSIYGVTINTAGSDKVEVDLYALDEHAALALREFMMTQIRATHVSTAYEERSSPEARERETLLMRIPAKNILLSSLFSNYRQGLALFVAFVASTYQRMQDVFEVLGRRSDYSVDVNNWRAVLSFVVAGAVFLILVPFAINLFRYFFRYYNFTIVRNVAGNFSMRYGLINTKDVIFHRQRVKTVSFRQNKLLRYFDLGYLTLRQIITDAAKPSTAVIDMPGIDRQNKRAVYDLIFETDIYAHTIVLRPRIGLFVNRTARAGAVLLGVLIGALIMGRGFEMAISAGAVFVLLMIVLYNYAYYRSVRFYVSDHFLIKRTNVWNEVETIVPVKNIQIVGVSQSFWQRRSGTAHLKVRTAADDVVFRYFDLSQINPIANRLLFKLERMSF